ncbi:hypothetical protein AB6A40_008414 [Gnathostoma spinigerum]|uniref:Uncharacterized protein n=1 Tax=Gnathostoma spinigerum TaxID=75299 RepID=A0ABD6EZG7_9BILA
MNILAKHFFEYQSFVNYPHKAVQLHKTPPSQAGADPSVSWGPKSMLKAGKNQSAPEARANRNRTDTSPSAFRHGRAGKLEFREWGDRHGALKDEKIIPSKDAWTKFLLNECGTAKSTPFDSDIEDRALQCEPETVSDKLSKIPKTKKDIAFKICSSIAAVDKSNSEILTILTYAGQIQFVTATVKRAKHLPYNNRPFARVMLFRGRHLIEQKQTTITTLSHCNGVNAIRLIH